MFDAITLGVATTTAGVTDVLTDNIVAIMGIFGALVGLHIAIRLVSKLIGRRM